MNILRWLLANQLRRSNKQKQISGFTLIELLVAMILAVLVITPLLGFMISILDTDRQEQAKVTSEQEIQTALDYIARDLQQAVYIYDATGINAIKGSLLGSSTTDNQVPVLVFWKREFIKGGKTYGTGSNAIVDDDFKYSLVAYYIIKGNDANNIWSKAVRIGRLQLVEGDRGFTVFTTSGTGTITDKMNAWTSNATLYTKNIVTLVDYINQTPITTAPTCTNISSTAQSSTPQLVPATTATDNLGGSVGFYACVASIASDGRSVVQVYLRGNALARLYNDEAKIAYSDRLSSYFPQTNVRVQGRSFLFTK